MTEQRIFLQLRAHIDEMLSLGAVIEAREPLCLSFAGKMYRIACGMLITEE